jgi:hypothetical protein
MTKPKRQQASPFAARRAQDHADGLHDPGTPFGPVLGCEACLKAAEDAGHGEVLPTTGGGYLRAACSCGWRSGYRRHRANDARHDWWQHVIFTLARHRT